MKKLILLAGGAVASVTAASLIAISLQPSHAAQKPKPNESPPVAQEAHPNDATVGMANPSTRCRNIKCSCIIKCNPTLPTCDYGASFGICVRDCMEKRGCPYGVTDDGQEQKGS